MQKRNHNHHTIDTQDAYTGLEFTIFVVKFYASSSQAYLHPITTP